ncbi:MAG TPA: hypothetical protein DIT37_01545 [Bacillus sp. (in: Bacteria)]|nr:hypothetical protein [Bacillus sp. (in: firmicutes)]
MYDAGMVAVLKFVAAKTLYDPQGAFNADIEWSESTVQAQENVDDLYEKLEGLLSHSKNILKDFDSAHAAKAGLEVEDAFVTGFVAGFRYLMDEAAYSKNVNFLK